jgi:hypothetical protein
MPAPALPAERRMNTRITSVAQLGMLVRASRRVEKLRLDDLAGCAGVGHVFVREVEHGKETVQLGKVLRLMDELGLHLQVNVPANVAVEFELLKAKGMRPLKARRKTKTPATVAPPTGSPGNGL